MPAPIPRAILDARVTHVRHRPKRYALSHRLWYLHLALGDLPRLPRWLMGYNRCALYSINDRDYGDGGRPLAEWITDVFRSAGADPPPDGAIRLLTLPRIAGLGFNPVSFWLCHDRIGALRAVLAEVNNTFGERHCYLCRKADGGVITAQDKITARKVFHVSPFLPVEGTYIFRFAEDEGRLGIFINLVRDGERVMFVSIAGRLVPLTSWALLARFLWVPLPAPFVLFLIHYHAAKLYLRGLKLFAKPPPPAAFVTTATAPDYSNGDR